MSLQRDPYGLLCLATYLDPRAFAQHSGYVLCPARLRIAKSNAANTEVGINNQQKQQQQQLNQHQNKASVRQQELRSHDLSSTRMPT